MLPLEAYERLCVLLRARGVKVATTLDGASLAGSDARAGWECFKQMAAEPAYEPFVARSGDAARANPARDGDLVLFETALPRPALGRTGFHAWFTRQFSFEDDDGEYLGMNGITLHVEWEMATALEPLGGTQLWGSGGPPNPAIRDDQHPEVRKWGGNGAAAWAARVETLDAFRVPFATAPVRAGFSQSDI